MLLDEVAEQKLIRLGPVLRAWFRHEMRAVRTAINRTLQTLGQSALPHPRQKGKRP